MSAEVRPVRSPRRRNTALESTDMFGVGLSREAKRELARSETALASAQSRYTNHEHTSDTTSPSSIPAPMFTQQVKHSKRVRPATASATPAKRPTSTRLAHPTNMKNLVPGKRTVPRTHKIGRAENAKGPSRWHKSNLDLTGMSQSARSETPIGPPLTQGQPRPYGSYFLFETERSGTGQTHRPQKLKKNGPSRNPKAPHWHEASLDLSGM
eukprot:6492711-Amphidinium_carterae.3